MRNQNTIRSLRRNYASLLLLTISLVANAQPGHIPVLKQQLAQSTASARTDTTRSRLLCALGEQYAEVNLDSSFFYLNQSLQTARHARDSVGTAWAMYQLGRTHLFYSKDEGTAIYWLRQALAIATPANNYACLGNCYSLLATVSYHQHIGNAEELLSKALAYAQKSRNNKTIADVYDIGYIVAKRLDPNNVKKQQYLLKQAMAASQQSDPDFYVTVGLDYCEVLTKNGKHGEALSMARRLDAQTSRLQKTQGEFVYTCDMGRLLGFLKKYEQAEATMVNGIAAEKRRSHPDSAHLYHYYRFLLDIYGQQENWQKAYRTRDTLATIELWLQRKRQTSDAKLKITQQEAAFNLNKKETQIALLDAQKQQQQVGLLGVGLLAVLLVGFVIVQHRSRQRIEQQRTELSQLNTQLTEVNTTKDKLFAILSHDLRAPMDNLTGYLMLHNWGALSPIEFDPLARNLAQRIEHLQTMLDNVLNWSLSQMGGFQLVPTPIALYELVQQEIQAQQPLADRKGIALANHIPPNTQLTADENHVAIIVRNLLHNALKFTSSGGSVRVNYAEISDRPQFTITDTGIGIPKNKLDSLFRLDHHPSGRGTNNEPGTGLGLVLVKELVTANGGEVAVQSLPGNGTTFTLLFPTAAAIRRDAQPVSELLLL